MSAGKSWLPGILRRLVVIALAVLLFPSAGSSQVPTAGVPGRSTELRLDVTIVVDPLLRIERVASLDVESREERVNPGIRGSLVVRSNVPFNLQARLTSPVAHRVVARETPSGDQPLSAGQWLTIAGGRPGEEPLTVRYRLEWAPQSPRRPTDLDSLPIEYRVIPAP